MARTKQQKLAKIIDNKSFADDMVISIGDHSLSVGELRQMDAETEGQSTADIDARQAELETREGTLAAAQNTTIELLNGVAEHLGCSLDDLIGGKWQGKAPKGGSTASGSTSSGTGTADDAALVAARKAFEPEINSLKEQLKQTREALGIGLRVSLDQYYEDTWDKLEGKVPKGADGKPLVKVDLKSVMEHAQKNKINDQRGRLNLRKAFDEMTQDARLQADISQAEERGAQRERERLQLGNAERPGSSRPVHLTTPPVNESGPNKGKVKSFSEALEDARNDTELWRAALGTGGGFGAA